MTFIELHFKGNPRLIAIGKISAVGCDKKDTFIWLIGDADCLYVDEPYDYIKSALLEVAAVWND